jgi:outer membrane protein assembly factor BamB
MYERTFLGLKWSQVLNDFETQNIDARIKFSDDGDTLVLIGSENMRVVVLNAENGMLIASAKIPSVTSATFNY